MVCADVSLEDLQAFHIPINDFVFDAGATIYNMNDPANAVYCVRHGAIKLMRYDASGNQRIVRLLKRMTSSAWSRFSQASSNIRRWR